MPQNCFILEKVRYVCERFKFAKLLFHSHNFGHNGPLAFGLGINGKNVRITGGNGISDFAYMDKILEERKVIDYYNQHFFQT
jgi:hypothetical protein